MFVLLDTAQAEHPVYFKVWTGIGPATTRDIRDAAQFATEQHAFESPAYAFPLTSFEPVGLEEFKYRCGWCGMPTDADGEPLGDDAPRARDKTEKVHGKCCPLGDQSDRRMQQVTHEMAMDAGDLSLEGLWIEW